MSTITGRSSSGEPSLDARTCAAVGAECRRVREARGLTVQAVSETLLLSTKQVRAIEAMDLSAFHNERFYLAALRKYATFAGVDAATLPAPPARVSAADEEAPAPRATMADESAGRRGLVMVGLAVAAVVLALAVAVGGGYTWWRASVDEAAGALAKTPLPASVPSAAPAPAEPVPAREPAVAPAVAEVPPAAVVPAVPAVPPEPSPAELAPFGSVRVPRATWMFLRYIDNSVVERPLAEGEHAVFEKPPVYLAVGAPDAELTVGSQRVNTAPFIVNGQLRVRASDFDALTAPADPNAPAVPAEAVR